MLIDESLPVYDVVERHRTEVRAPVGPGTKSPALEP